MILLSPVKVGRLAGQQVGGSCPPVPLKGNWSFCDHLKAKSHQIHDGARRAEVESMLKQNSISVFYYARICTRNSAIGVLRFARFHLSPWRP